MSRIAYTMGMALLAGFLCLVPAPAAAHIFPRHSEPKAGETITAAPRTVRIWFDGDLEPAFSRVMIEDSSGGQVDTGDCRVDRADPKLIEVGAKPLKPGRYTVKWDIVSRDGHRTKGDFTFTVK